MRRLIPALSSMIIVHQESKMANQEWVTNIGAVGGIVGAITGIGGLVLAVLAFRRTGQLKALDLRLELRRCERSLRSDANDIIQLLESARASHTRLGAAQGNFHSGAMQQWLAEWDTDLVSGKSLMEHVAVLGAPDEGISQAELETRLNTVQDLQLQLAKLSGKYRDVLSKDDASRIQLQADHRAAMQARIEGKL